MDALFPFNLPTPTIWYVVLYVVTLLLHVVFMSYVLAGSIMLGLAGGRGMLGHQSTSSAWSPVTTVLKDWMPFALSAAITAGIAPLLFVQILYQQEFYTANLLAFHRWMAILPVLIVAFYLLYLLKAHRIEGRVALQGIVAVVVMACVLFVAWSWVENHLLSLDRGAWARQYETKSMMYANASILPRLGFWIASAFPLAATLLAWQFRAGASGVKGDAAALVARPLATLGVVSLFIAALAAWMVIPAPAHLAARGDAGDSKVWLGVAGGGAMVWALGWILHMRPGKGTTFSLSLASVGAVLFWLGLLVAREAVRWSIAGTPANVSRHERVGTLAGFVVFLTFAVIGIGTVAWIVRTVSRARTSHRIDR